MEATLDAEQRLVSEQTSRHAVPHRRFSTLPVHPHLVSCLQAEIAESETQRALRAQSEESAQLRTQVS